MPPAIKLYSDGSTTLKQQGGIIERQRFDNYICRASPTNRSEENALMKAKSSKETRVSKSYDHPKCENISCINVRYFIEYHNEIGRGTHTKVHSCIDRKTGKRLAIKTAPKTKKQLKKQIQREASILFELDHPNILHFKNFVQDDKALYVVSELCEGGDLFQAVVKKSNVRSFSEEEAGRILQQLLDALEYLHSRNICHRDIKLDNILFSNRRKLQIKLVDFDLAIKHTEQDTPLSNLAGTYHYMAPEVINKSYSKSCDIWSLGVVAFALLSGKVPFSDADQRKTFDIICNQELIFPSSDRWDEITEVAKDFIRRCLVKDPSQRGSIKDLLQHEWIRKSRATKPLSRFQKLKKVVGLNQTCKSEPSSLKSLPINSTREPQPPTVSPQMSIEVAC